METPLTPNVVGAQDRELIAPSGAVIKTIRFNGAIVMQVIARSMNGGKSAVEEDDLQFNLIELTATYNGQQLTRTATDEMPGADLMFLMGEFAKSINVGADQTGVPDGAPEGYYYKRLPSGMLVIIQNFKGKHIKDAQRQMKKDGSDFFQVLMSRLIRICGVVNDLYLSQNPTCKLELGTPINIDLFPEDIEGMDGLDVFALFGEVSAAMFPQAGADSIPVL